MWAYILDRLKEFSTWKGLAAFTGGVLMFFCPKLAGEIVMALVTSWGLIEIFRIEKSKIDGSGK